MARKVLYTALHDRTVHEIRFRDGWVESGDTKCFDAWGSIAMDDSPLISTDWEDSTGL